MTSWATEVILFKVFLPLASIQSNKVDIREIHDNGAQGSVATWMLGFIFRPLTCHMMQSHCDAGSCSLASTWGPCSQRLETMKVIEGAHAQTRLSAAQVVADEHDSQQASTNLFYGQRKTKSLQSRRQKFAPRDKIATRILGICWMTLAGMWLTTVSWSFAPVS